MPTVAHLLQKLKSSSTFRAVYGVIRKHGPLTRTQVSRLVPVSKPTCYSLIDELVSLGAVAEEATGSGGRRRSPSVRAARDLCTTIGLDIHMEGIHALVMDSGLEVEAETFIPNQVDPGGGSCSDSRETVNGRIEEALRRSLSAIEARSLPRPTAVCVSASGTIDDREGVCVANPYIPSWHDVPVRSMIRRVLPVDVFLARGSNLVTISEARLLGSGAAPNLLCLSLKRGVGLGIMIGGRLYTGDTGNAGRLSATRMAGWVDAAAPPAETPGGDPTVDSLLGLSAILAPERRRTGRTPRDEDGAVGLESSVDRELRDLLGRYEDGAAVDVLRRYLDRLAAVIADLSLVLDIRQVILAGRYVHVGPRLLGDVRGLVTDRLPPGLRRSLDVRTGSLGLRAYAWGAAYLAQEIQFSAEGRPA